MRVQGSWRETLGDGSLHLVSALDLGEGDGWSDKVDVLLDVLRNVILAATDMVFLGWEMVENVILGSKETFHFVDRSIKLEPASAG